MQGQSESNGSDCHYGFGKAQYWKNALCRNLASGAVRSSLQWAVLEVHCVCVLVRHSLQNADFVLGWEREGSPECMWSGSAAGAGSDGARQPASGNQGCPEDTRAAFIGRAVVKIGGEICLLVVEHGKGESAGGCEEGWSSGQLRGAE